MKQVENYTRTIYSLLMDENYNEVLKILENELHSFPDSTAIHSIMAFCYWQQEDYQKACTSYGKLSELNPTNDLYKLHHANCLYKTEQYYEAMRVSFGIQDPDLKAQASLLQAAIRYAEDDVQSSKAILAQNDQEDMDVMLDQACVLYREDRFEEALEKYMEVKRVHGFNPEVAYCIALCYYRMSKLTEAVQMIAEIKSQAARAHPELLRSLAGDSVDFDAQGLIQKAKDAFLVEALNLMSALDYDQKHFKEARDVIRELPNRNEEELDPVTLHNTALVTMEDDPSSAFSKLTFLLQQEPSPPETFRNLLLGYCKYEYYSLAADLLAENTELALKTMGKPMMDFLDAYLMCATSKEEAYRKFDSLCKSNADILRRLMREVDESRKTHDDQQQINLTVQFEAAVNDLVPILMAQAKIFWDMEKYQLVELLLLKYADFCVDNRTWKLNLAHTYFMEPGKMMDAIGVYEPLVCGENNLLDVEAIIVADLCVAYVVTEQNDMADNLINRVTEEEAAKLKEDENAKLYHLAIIHLVIGTLYCAHKNFDFGIDYLFKAFNPMHQKLNADTWFYAKKCLFEMLRSMAFRQFMPNDKTFEKICQFLDEVDKHGKKMDSIIDLTIAAEEARENQTVSFEARVIKAMLLRIGIRRMSYVSPLLNRRAQGRPGNPLLKGRPGTILPPLVDPSRRLPPIRLPRLTQPPEINSHHALAPIQSPTTGTRLPALIPKQYPKTPTFQIPEPISSIVPRCLSHPPFKVVEQKQPDLFGPGVPAANDELVNDLNTVLRIVRSKGWKSSLTNGDYVQVLRMICRYIFKPKQRLNVRNPFAESVPIYELTNYGYLEIVHGILQTLLLDVNVVKLFIDKKFIMYIIDELDTPVLQEQQNVENEVSQIMQCLPEMGPFILKTLRYKLKAYCDGYKDSYCVSPILRLVKSFFEKYEEIVPDMDAVYRVDIVPLYFTDFLSDFEKPLRALTTYFCKRNGMNAEFCLKALLRHWPVTCPKKEVSFLQQLSLLLQNSCEQSLPSLCAGVLSVLARCIESAHSAVALGACFLLMDGEFLCSFACVKDLFLVVLVPALRKASSHWKADLKSMAEQLLQTLGDDGAIQSDKEEKSDRARNVWANLAKQTALPLSTRVVL